MSGRAEKVLAAMTFLFLTGLATRVGLAEPDKAAGSVPAGAKSILAIESPWRWRLLNRKPIITAEALKAAGKDATGPAVLPAKTAWGGPGWLTNLDTPLPGDDWSGADFKDADWPRSKLPIFEDLSVTTGNVCARGRFTVTDLAAIKSLHLSLKYRGGVTVYLNGKEVARADMPDGPATLVTPGKPYPPEAYLDAAGKTLTDPGHCKGDDAVRVANRTRVAAAIEIPTAGLRKGVNVLAIASHRSDYHPVALTWWNTNSYVSGRPLSWAPVGLFDVQLSAVGEGVEPNVVRPKGLQLWSLDIHDRLDFATLADAGQDLPPAVSIVGSRNGVFSGAVVLTSDAAIKGAKAVVADLAGPSGARIPATAVHVRGAVWCANVRHYDMLTTMPAEVPVNQKAAALPIWITVRVPKDAVAGEYRGELTVSADGLKPTACPVTLNVASWTAPDPKDFRTYNGMCQSPDTLAAVYKVPMWSDEHWKLMDKSFELLGGLGNRMLHVPLLTRTQFGNDEGMVWWVKKADGTHDYDFTVFDRYLEMAKKHCGNLEFVVFHVWVSAAWGNPRKLDQELYVTCLDKATGKREPLRVPTYATEESRAFWQPVLAALKDRLTKAGLGNAMTIGNVSDQPVAPEAVKMFSEIAPGVCWWRACHSVTNDPKPYPIKNGGLVSIHEHVYGMVLADPEKGLPRIWNQRGPGATYLRGSAETDWGRTPLNWRLVPEYALYQHKRGVGRECIDYYHMGTKTEHGDFYARYPQSADGHSIPYASYYSQPGPDGPTATIRYELFREGMQESEATMLIAEAADTKADALGKDLADTCRRLFIERINTVRTARGVIRGNEDFSGWQHRSAELYKAAAEVAAKTGAK